MPPLLDKILHLGKAPSEHEGSQRIVSTNTEGATVVDLAVLFQDEAFIRKAEEFREVFKHVKSADLSIPLVRQQDQR